MYTRIIGGTNLDLLVQTAPKPGGNSSKSPCGRCEAAKKNCEYGAELTVNLGVGSAILCTGGIKPSTAKFCTY